MSALTIDDLRFELRPSPRRRSMQITVDRGGELLLSAPEGAATAALEAFVRAKRFWIYTKLAEKEALGPRPAGKQYVSGEGFPYLGRSYRLLLVDADTPAVTLSRGRFLMARGAAAEGRAHLRRWYTERAAPWLCRRVGRLSSRVGARPASVTVQDLGYRWGSCGKGGRLYFHWQSILLPPRIVDYIVVHELSHLLVPHHTPDFWARVERALPDFAARKQWLAEHGREAVLL